MKNGIKTLQVLKLVFKRHSLSEQRIYFAIINLKTKIIWDK
jgi:hypothetical protein